MTNTDSSKLRIALLSDIHGNRIALDAVLADIDAQGGVDEYWILGDLAAIGPQPIAALERLDQLPNKRFVRGNTDRYTVSGDRPYPSSDEVKADLGLLPLIIEVAHSFAWTQGIVASHGWFEFMESLPLEHRLTLPDGTRLLGVHAAPGLDDGAGIYPELTEPELEALLAGCEADLVCVGHTHWPMNIQVGNVHVINLGSISNHRMPSLCSSYVMLAANESGYHAQHHQVAYDREEVIKQLQDMRHPAIDFITGYLRGEKLASYGEPDVFE